MNTSSRCVWAECSGWTGYLPVVLLAVGQHSQGDQSFNVSTKFPSSLSQDGIH